MKMQECIPAGYIPTTAVAAEGGVSVQALAPSHGQRPPWMKTPPQTETPKQVDSLEGRLP